MLKIRVFSNTSLTCPKILQTELSQSLHIFQAFVNSFQALQMKRQAILDFEEATAQNRIVR